MESYDEIYNAIVDRKRSKDTRVINPLTKASFIRVPSNYVTDYVSWVAQNNCNGFYDKDDDYINVILTNIACSKHFGFNDVFHSRQEIDIFVRYYSSVNGQSVIIERVSETSVRYRCPIQECNCVYQYNFYDDGYHLEYYHFQDINKCSKYDADYIELFKHNTIRESSYDYYKDMISDSINNQTNDTNDSINSNYTSITITQEECKTSQNLKKIFMKQMNNQSFSKINTFDIVEEIYIEQDIDDNLTKDEEELINKSHVFTSSDDITC
ncbi:hypothetical protein WA158_002253 [Blastocystis sp. Blastoise]